MYVHRRVLLVRRPTEGAGKVHGRRTGLGNAGDEGCDEGIEPDRSVTVLGVKKRGGSSVCEKYQVFTDTTPRNDLPSNPWFLRAGVSLCQLPHRYPPLW